VVGGVDDFAAGETDGGREGRNGWDIALRCVGVVGRGVGVGFGRGLLEVFAGESG